jgi:glyoxylase-like metal-dependent hydrolase (beta-lactamase superfamily II)
VSEQSEKGKSEVAKLSELVTRLRAPNPGPMTLTGTNSYLVGMGPERVAIDPGPKLEGHLQTMAGTASAAGAKISLILVTHGHPDHYPGAERLSELTGAPVAAYRGATFPHQVELDNEQKIEAAGGTYTAIFTPGHAADHLCYFLEEEGALFTGDNILGYGTTIVAPPKGDMALYMASLHLLEEKWGQAKVIYGGHGPEIANPAAKIREYILHRQARQQQLVEAMQAGATTIPQIVERIYQDVDRRMWPAAARQALAYLIMLEREGKVRAEDLPAEEVSEADNAMLNPVGTVIDPVAAAELGISAQEMEHKDKVKRYWLTL